MKTRNFGIGLLMALGMSGSVNAATIAYAGSVSDSEVNDWRTAGTAKTLDIDGDNQYGSTIGAVHWTEAATGQQSPGSSTLGWAFISSDSQTSNASFTDIDHVNNYPTNDDGALFLTLLLPTSCLSSLEWHRTILT